MSPAVPAKVTPPSPGDVYPRPRLFRWLDASDNKLIWIEGPPGSGKTTVAASYLSVRKQPVLWYQVDVGDQDPGTFFHYLDLAAKRVAQERRASFPRLTPEQFPGLEVFAHRYFEALDLTLPAAAALVFDNLHELDAASPLHSVIVSGLERLNANRTVMLLSRAALPPAYSRLSVNRRLVRLDWQMLRLTEEETAGICRLLAGQRGADSARQLHQITQGWIAGLILMLEDAAGIRDGALLPEASNVRALFGYFALEVLARHDAPVRDFLMLTALLPNFSVAMAERLTANRGSRALLKDLARQHRFTEERNEGELKYQYHPLFREFLLDRARNDWEPERYAEQATKAAHILEEAGQIEHAWALYRETGEWAAAVRLILQAAPSLAQRARLQTLEHWLAELPPDQFDAEPWLSYWRGMCRLSRSPAAAIEDFEQAYSGFDVRDDPVGLYLSWSGISQGFQIEWSDFGPIDRWIAAFEALRTRHPEMPSPQIETTVVGAIVCALTNRHMNHPQLPQWLVRAEENLKRRQDEPPAWWELQLAWYFLWMGQLERGAAVVARFESIRDEQSQPPLLQLFSRVAQATYQWTCASLDAADQFVAEGIAIAQRHGLSHWLFPLLGQGAYASLARGQAERAADYLAQMQSLVGARGRLDAAMFHHLTAMTRAHHGDTESAQLHGERALQLAHSSGHQFAIASCAYGLLNIALLRADFDGIELRLKEVQELASLTGSRVILLWSRVSETLLAFRKRETTRGLHLLRETMSLSRELRGHALPWPPHRLLAELCLIALNHDIDAAHVASLIRRFAVAVPESGPIPDSWPYAVQIHTLGRFRVLIEGRPLTFRTKSQKKPLELLKTLIASGGKAVREDSLCESLWSDAEADAAAHALTSTLHRLRKLLGVEAVHRQNGLLTLDPGRCRVDAWMLERLLTTLASACRGPDLDEIAGLTLRALESYQGPFLHNESDSPLLLVARERLHAKVLRHVETAARRLIDDARYPDAIECYRRATELDALNESLYRGLIESLLAAGQSAEALRTFERCRRVLSSCLQAQPSSATFALVRHLLPADAT